MNTKWSLLPKVLVVTYFVIVSVACSKGPLGLDWQNGGQFGSSDSSLSAPNVTNAYTAAAMSILSQNCTSCHGTTSGPLNVFNLTDPNHLISSGLVVAGSPAQSPLFTAISGGTMPPGGALSASDINTIQQWIIAAGSTASGGGSGGTTPTPAPTPIALSASYASLEANIFQPKCVGCHSSSSAASGYAFDSYSQVMNAVNTSNPAGSAVYVVTKNGSMPRGGSHLTSQELSALLTWIQNGAQNN
jgi:mono/diheme cytochrome c family protein